MIFSELGVFDSVLDVGGNVGEFAERCRQRWPGARITSFEPIPSVAQENERRAGGRWLVEQVALGAADYKATLRVCTNQPSASSLLAHGPLRRKRFGIADVYLEREVPVYRLDRWRPGVLGRLLVKVDVEGFELEVLRGAPHVLECADVVACEVQQSPEIFAGAPSFTELDDELSAHGLRFAGVEQVQLDPSGEVVQFDGVWRR